MAHQTISVYFPDDTLLEAISKHLAPNNSISAFIVQATQEKLKTLTATEPEPELVGEKYATTN
jgi:hypothetical protein